MRKLIEIMRDSGYPGYDQNGLNSVDRVSARLEAKFVPQAVQDAVRHFEKTSDSIVQEKVATPAEPAKEAEHVVRGLSPS